MSVPDMCDKGHHGMMRKFEKNGQEWYSCTFKYQDGKTCWGKVPKDAPLYDEDTNTDWRTPPRAQSAANPTILGDALSTAWSIVLTLGDMATLSSLGSEAVAEEVRKMAMFLQTGERAPMNNEEKLRMIAELKRQMEQVGANP